MSALNFENDDSRTKCRTVLNYMRAGTFDHSKTPFFTSEKDGHTCAKFISEMQQVSTALCERTESVTVYNPDKKVTMVHPHTEWVVLAVEDTE